MVIYMLPMPQGQAGLNWVESSPEVPFMTRLELDAALARLGLTVPEAEKRDIAVAVKLLDDMLARLRPSNGYDVAAEPAHTVAFPKE